MDGEGFTELLPRHSQQGNGETQSLELCAGCNSVEMVAASRTNHTLSEGDQSYLQMVVRAIGT